MAQRLSTASRRMFLKTVSQGMLLAGAGLLIPASFAQSSSFLASRQGKSELLLHFNENSLGMSANALKAAKNAVELMGNRYADKGVNILRSELAAQHGVKSEQVLLGNGSTEVIGAVVNYAAHNKASVLEPNPTFGDVKRRSQAQGMAVQRVDVGEGFVTDIAQLKKHASKIKGPLLINICNPNNPTGTIVDQSALHEWILNAPYNHLFLIDEAYFEYAQLNPNYASVLPLIKSGKENLVLTRTFSKIYGMAGMRVGYGIAAPATAKKIEKFATTFNLSAAGVAAASASLKDDAFYQHSLASNQQAKTILTDTLSKLHLPFVPSNTNFVLHRINSDLATYSERMKQNNIRVGRRMTKEHGWNRISVGTPEEMQEFTQALKAFRDRGWV